MRLLLIIVVFLATSVSAEPSLVYLQSFSTANALLSASPAPELDAQLESVVADEPEAAGWHHEGIWNGIFKGLQLPFGRHGAEQHHLQQQQNDEDASNGILGSFSVDIGQYEDEAVFRFFTTSDKEREKLKYASETLMLDIWEMDADYANVRVTRRRLGDFLRLLPKSMRKRYEEVVGDVQRAVFSSYPLRAGPRSNKNSDKSLATLFEDYRDLSRIYEWLDMFESQYETFVRGECLGITYEKRELHMVRLGPGSAANSIVVTGGFQGRDWVSVSNALYVMHAIANEYNQTGTGLLANTAVYFVPIVNPDGYAYTWEHDRLWRKNRQPTGVSLCSGIDIEHSFGLTGVTPLTRSTMSVTPCSENYGGYKPYEAVEAKHLHNLIASIKPVGYLQLGSSSPPLTAVTTGPSDGSLRQMVSDHRRPLRLLSYDKVQQTHGKSTLLEKIGHSALLLNAGSSDDLGVLAPRRVLGETGELAVSVFREWANQRSGSMEE